jgi:hypothetical protein
MYRASCDDVWFSQKQWNGQRPTNPSLFQIHFQSSSEIQQLVMISVPKHRWTSSNFRQPNQRKPNSKLHSNICTSYHNLSTHIPLLDQTSNFKRCLEIPVHGCLVFVRRRSTESKSTESVNQTGQIIFDRKIISRLRCFNNVVLSLMAGKFGGTVVVVFFVFEGLLCSQVTVTPDPTTTSRGSLIYIELYV